MKRQGYACRKGGRRALWANHEPNRKKLVKMVKEMDKKMDALAINAGTQKAKTWAEIAATNAARMLPPTTQWLTVRVRLQETEGKTLPELLEAVKPAIQGAIAVRQLRSGDVEVAMTDQKAKDRALNQTEVEGCKVLRQDYPVEIPGIPLTTGIKHGKAVENDEVAKAICAETKRIIPSIVINRIRWLHDAKGHQDRIQAGKTRGTAIISFPTQALQHEAIRKGIVIGAELFEAKLYNNSLEMKQCFKCYGWGHTQTACGRRERCGECAGNHPTKECTKERVSCVNCGKEHRAWQKKACGTFQAFLEETQRKRINLIVQTAAIRGQQAQFPPASAPPITQPTWERPTKDQTPRHRMSNRRAQRGAKGGPLT